MAGKRKDKLKTIKRTIKIPLDKVYPSVLKYLFSVNGKAGLKKNIHKPVHQVIKP